MLSTRIREIEWCGMIYEIDRETAVETVVSRR
jgi:hypothetical protein